MFTSLMRMLVILGVSAGAAAGYIGTKGLRWIPNVEEIIKVQEQRKKLRAEAAITLGEFRSLIEQGAVVIDARPQEEFEEGHLETGFYPPVLNIPPEDVDEHIDRLMELQGYPIVLYCTSPTCEFAEDVYMVLEEYGFYDMRIYYPGWEGIQEAGLDTATGPDTWTGFDAEPNAPLDGEHDAGGDEEVSDPNTPDEIEP